ncbi:outer membrane PBP1 activator LpoA protein [Natronospira proteinivora]|uniref:Outer membrane PBP1 activator LpoA protein n=1 Tax=Natronospira proteinivora TaxID=1807133 RepID=A0ABT1G489_9GAMM|nr:penicillin-binding protein activator [Natronospira proteinivora]MCP1726095.1 outer membrane PBP1 activator LpoA protein [Natronospira proteinivora]
MLPLLLAALMVLLWACAPTPVEPDPLPEEEIELMRDSAQLLRDTGDPAAAAEIYEDIARASDEIQRAEWMIRAAEAWIEASETERARSLVESLAPAELDRATRFRLAIVLARADLADNRPRQALARLDVREEGVPREVLPTLLAVRGEAHFSMDNVIGGIADIQRQADLLTGEARLNALQDLWDRLLGLPSLPGQEAAAGRPLVAGWLNLARAGQESWQRPDQFDRTVSEWAALHRDHPATELMDQLLAEQRERFRYPEQIALLLPLSGRFSAPAEAARDGFLAAHFNQPADRRPIVRVYDTGNAPERIGEIYRQAVEDGAGLVVGPLTRPALSALLEEERPVPVLGLNYLLDEQAGGPDLIQFGLQPEAEARQVARRVFREGEGRAIALIPDSEWGYRMLDAFRESLEEMGGELLDYDAFRPQARDFSGGLTRVLGLNRSQDRRRQLAQVIDESLEFEPRRRGDIDAIFLAAQDGQASLIRPQLRFHHALGVPVYASSHVYRPGQAPDSDLDGIRFADMPWSIAEAGDARAERERVARLWPELFEQHGRLFALGFDAYRLVPILMNFEEPLQPPLAAMTGVLSLDDNNRIQRELGWAQFVRGIPVPMEPRDISEEIEAPAAVDLELE